MDKTKAYQIINRWLEPVNKDRKLAFESEHKGCFYSLYLLAIQYHMLVGRFGTKHSKWKHPPANLSPAALMIIDEYTIEYSNYWAFRIGTAAFVRTGGRVFPVNGPEHFLLLKKSGKIYPRSDAFESFQDKIDRYLEQDLPESDWDIKPEN